MAREDGQRGGSDRACGEKKKHGPPLKIPVVSGAGNRTARGVERLSIGLHKLFRQTKRKTEGPQQFAFPEISRENRGCLEFGAPFWKLASFPESESWSGHWGKI